VLVALSGVDCAGKSTQIERLVARLCGAGVPVSVFWLRPGYSPELNRLRALVRRLRPGAIPRQGDVQARGRALARWPVALAWFVVALGDLALQYAVKVRWRAWRGVVVCDRYLDDAIMDLELEFERWARAARVAGRILRVLAPRPDASLLLLLPLDEAVARAERKREPFADSPEVRRRRYDAYLALARTDRHTVVDATGTIEGVHHEVWSRVAPLLLDPAGQEGG
jgi:thymidylate kinase